MSSKSFIPDGCVGLWFPGRGHPEQRRGTVLDLSGQNNHGTIMGVPCLYFDGVGDRLVPTVFWDPLGGHRYVYLAVQIFPFSTADIREIYYESWVGDATKRRFAVSKDASDMLLITVNPGISTDTPVTSTSTNALDIGAWQSLLIAVDLVADNDTPIAYVWKNGEVFEMGDFSGTVTKGTFQATVPAFQRFSSGYIGLNSYGYWQWLGYGGKDTLPTSADAQRFHDFHYAWLAQSGLDAYWNCKTDSGLTLSDDSGNGHTLNIVGPVWNSYIATFSEQLGPCGGDARNAAGTANSGDSFNAGYRFFDGSDDCITVANAASLIFGTAPFQIHVWAAISATAVDSAAIIGKGREEAGDWYLRVGVDDSLKVYAVDSGGVNVINIGGGIIRDGSLHLCSLLRNGNDFYLYVDAAQVATASSVMNLNTTKVLQMMASESLNPCKGNLYKAFIGTANKTIAQAEADMSAIYNQGPYR